MGKPTPDSSRILPFLPFTLARWYGHHRGRIHGSTRHEGALACLDASGFTALTGRLEARGQDGPEILTQILNAFFAAVIDVAQQYGGDVLKFSGDGLWLYLPDAKGVWPMAEAAQSALRELNNNHAQLRSNPISLHLGAELGSFELISFGNAEYRLEAEPVGPTVTEAYSCCDQAVPGQLVVGPELKRLQANTSNLPPEASREGAQVHAGGMSPEDEGSLAGGDTGQADPLLWRYIPEALLGRFSERTRTLQVASEYREVTVVFCNCSWDVQTCADHGQSPIECVGQMIRCVHTCEGSLARIDPFKDGHKLLILFGAPVARSDDQWRALECARQLGTLNQGGFHVRAGVARGRTFCGAVGSSTRMEYTVMGSAANLAARLMAKAEWGAVLFDDTMRGLLPKTVVSTSHEISVKGFTKPLTVYRLDHLDDQAAPSAPEPFLEDFRHPSYRQILERWEELTRQRTHGAIFVHGSHGSGKSHLLRTSEQMVDRQYRVSLDAKQAIFFGPAYLARKLLSQLAAINPDVEASGLDHWVNRQGMTELLPVLKGVVKGASDDNVWTKDLSPQLRLQKAQELFAELVRRLLCGHVYVLIDDMDKADAFSRQLVLALCRANPRLDLTFLISGSDAAPTPSETDADSPDSLELSSPSDGDWRRYLTGCFVDGRREEEFVERLITQSGCLPGIVFDFLKERMATGDLAANPIAGKWELRHSASALTIPGSARELHLERFDALPEKLRTILKTGAVNPTEFTADLIAYENAELLAEDIHAGLGDLCRRGILHKDEFGRICRFTNGSLRDAIYECIPHVDLKVWHSRCAQWVEQHHGDRVALLAYHYANAQIADKGFAYSLQAAKDALSLYALADAARHFESCRQLMASDPESRITTARMVEFHQAFAQFLVLEGRPKEAYRTFRAWRRLATRASDPASALSAALGSAELLWQQSQYGRCTRVLQAALAKVAPHTLSGLVARGMTLLAEVARRTARFAEAESWARKALEESDDPSALADAHNRLGLALWGQGRLPDAVESLQKSLSSGHGTHSMYNRARVANNLAIVHWQMGALVQAEPLMREAIEIFRRQGDRRNEAYARGNFAALIREFGKHTDARRMLSEADVIFERLDDRHAHNYTVGNLGDIDLISGDLESAGKRFAEALAFAESVEDGELQAECKVRLGEVAFFAGDARSAERTLEAAIELAEKIGSGEFALRARVGLARVRVGLKEIDSLPPLAERIRRDAQESRTAVMDQEGRFLQGEYLRITGDIAAAQQCFEEVFAYAKDQNLFELSLKCAVRIAELANPSHLATGQFLVELGRKYESDNGPGSWERLLDSAYFSFFRPVLVAVTRTSCLTPANNR
jgi:class 3 adenylate cyclase/tetratricopeptide (TPR) repeat protein